MKNRKQTNLNDATKNSIRNALAAKSNRGVVKIDIIKELNDLKDERNKLEIRTREKTYSIITRVYGLARACKNDNDSWQDFCREDFFRSRKQKPKSHKPEEALRFFFAYLFDGSAKERQTLSKYNRALAAAFAEDLAPDVVAEMLKNEGIETLARKNAKKRGVGNSETGQPIIIYQKSPAYIKRLAEMGCEGEFIITSHVSVKKKDENTTKITRIGTDISPL
ncbi:hypothetical protein F9K87_00570 [Brucella anthropi]|uniref:hypothetical protein n=1 Tax=Brucella anthropi TaxID=529 RepID=UPI00124C9C03|nr:hypothetical protein [Brucella anthropi]KAB2800006.1 hypothetical protein F9K87_00570 [Brucella anthropi]